MSNESCFVSKDPFKRHASETKTVCSSRAPPAAHSRVNVGRGPPCRDFPLQQMSADHHKGNMDYNLHPDDVALTFVTLAPSDPHEQDMHPT
ncbi:unnamed protein product [Gadus morhua 'NCC']